MHAHRIKVLDRADDDAIVILVAHHLHLELFPAEQGFFDQQFLGRRGLKATFADFEKFVAVIGNATARTTHREAGANDGWKANRGLHLQRFLHRVRD